MSHLMNVFARQDIAFTHGDGVWLYDESGRRYLDALGGIAVSTLGHNHPRLVRAIAEQAAKVLHTSNLYRIPQQEALAEHLCALSSMSEAFFCNSGCEANEAAIKLARYYGHKNKGASQPQIIVMENAFHGRTLATLSATGNRKVQAGFEPLVGGFIRVPFNDIEAVQNVALRHQDVVAVLLEPIQGEGGLTAATPEYLRALAILCDQYDWLFMVDEVQCGIGRTGKWFGWQQVDGIRPDVMTLAKGLAGGVPIGACLAAGRAANVFGPGNHGSTFGGNPLACAAALETLAVIADEGLLANAAQTGQYIRESLAAALKDTGCLRAVRGNGLMIGIELEHPCGELVDRAREKGVLINVTHGNVIRLLPPLTFTREHADILIPVLAEIIRAFSLNHRAA